MSVDNVQTLQEKSLTTKSRSLARVLTTRVGVTLAVAGVAYLAYKSRTNTDIVDPA